MTEICVCGLWWKDVMTVVCLAMTSGETGRSFKKSSEGRKASLSSTAPLAP